MFTEYTGNRQFDLQLNRTFAPILDRVGMETIATATLPRVRSTQQIAALAQSLAERFSTEGDADAAWRLYELAAFYLGADNPVSGTSSTRHRVTSMPLTLTWRCADIQSPIKMAH